MKVLERAITPDGINIQLEDWSEHNTKEYPNLYGLTIGAYPEAKNSSKYKLIRKDEKFRLAIAQNHYHSYTNDDVKSDYEALKSGEKKLEDLSSRFWNLEKDMWYLGMDVEYRGKGW